MSSSYSDIALYRFDMKSLSYTPKVLHCKRFRDDIFAVWNHSLQELPKFFEFMNSINTSGKVKFTIFTANNDFVLEFLDLSLHVNKHNKIYVDVYAKPTNSFTHVLQSICYPKKNINIVPKEIAIMCIRVLTPHKKTISLFFAKTLLNLQTVQAPLFKQFPPLDLFFVHPSPKILYKILFTYEQYKY